MAKAPQPNLPLLYKDLLPLSSKDHAAWKTKPMGSAKFLLGYNAIPVTSDELVTAGRYYPVIFSSGENPVPLALMGLNEGVNVYLKDDGEFYEPVYLPAYVRRYPFILVRLNEKTDDLSLCFDPTSKFIGKYKDGDALFANGERTETLDNIMQFCQEFEAAGQRTKAFMDQLVELELLMEGEVAIQQEGKDNPFIYRGFQMVDEQKLRDLAGDKLRKLSQNGALPLIYAHLFSMQIMREVFGKQMQQGKVPETNEVALPEQG